MPRIVVTPFFFIALAVLVSTAAWAGPEAGSLQPILPKTEKPTTLFGYAGKRPLDPSTRGGIARTTPAPRIETAAFGAAVECLPVRPRMVTPTPGPGPGRRRASGAPDRRVGVRGRVVLAVRAVRAVLSDDAGERRRAVHLAAPVVERVPRRQRGAALRPVRSRVRPGRSTARRANRAPSRAIRASWSDVRRAWCATSPRRPAAPATRRTRALLRALPELVRSARARGLRAVLGRRLGPRLGLGSRLLVAPPEA